jgi:hypothetical protein
MTREPLNCWAHVRLNRGEQNALLFLQARLGLRTRSRVLRKMIREAVGEGPDLLPNDLNVMREAIRQVAALGRNINQLTRAANAGDRVTVDPVLLRAAVHEIMALRKELVAVIMRSRNRWVRHD